MKFTVVILSSILIISLLSGCIKSEKENKTDEEIAVYITLLFSFEFDDNYTTSFDVLVNDELKLSKRNYEFPPMAPMTLSVPQFNTSKEQLEIEVKELLNGMSNITVLDSNNGSYILIRINIHDEIQFQQSKIIWDIA